MLNTEGAVPPLAWLDYMPTRLPGSPKRDCTPIRSVCHEVGEDGCRQALSSPVGNQYGSDGSVRQPSAEAWSVRVWTARVIVGRASSARCRSVHVQMGTGDRTGRRVNVGGIGATCRLGDSSTGRRKRPTWSKNAGPAMPPSSILVTDAWVAFARAET